jgi:hypothetical protein
MPKRYYLSFLAAYKSVEDRQGITFTVHRKGRSIDLSAILAARPRQPPDNNNNNNNLLLLFVENLIDWRVDNGISDCM